MDGAPPRDFARTLVGAREGDERSAAALLPIVYTQLRRIASGYLKRYTGHCSLQPTALVHEAYLHLCGAEALSFADRTHFVAVAATAMRHVLVDSLRRAGADKRGGGRKHVTLDAECLPIAVSSSPIDVLALDVALTRLAERSARQARIVELLFFGGLTLEEVAQALDVSRSLVDKELRRARAWIRRELSMNEGEGGDGT